MKRLLFVVSLLAAGATQAAGFNITTHSARATGMSTAVTAHLDDASTMAYNPAGLAAIDALDVQVGDTLIYPHVNFQLQGSDVKQSTETWIGPPPHLYLAYPFLQHFAAGVGVYVPFGDQIRWPADFVGRELATESKLYVLDINPTVAYAPVDWIRFGVGLQILYSDVSLRRQVAIPGAPAGTEGSTHLSGNDWGAAVDVGLQVEVVRHFLNFGATYRSRGVLNYQGSIEFSDIPAPAQPFFQTSNASAKLTLPASLALGVAVFPVEHLRVAFDATWWQWQTVQELAIVADNPLYSSTLPKKFHNRWSFHLGGEYGVSKLLTLRAGAGYDKTPIPDETLTPELPDATRLIGNLGVGLTFGHINVGAGYEFLWLQNKTSTSPLLPGTYDGTAHVLSVTVGYKGQGCERQ